MTEEQIKRLKKYIKIGKVPMLIKKVPENVLLEELEKIIKEDLKLS